MIPVAVLLRGLNEGFLRTEFNAEPAPLAPLRQQMDLVALGLNPVFIQGLPPYFYLQLITF